MIFVAVIPLAVGLTLSARWAVRKALSKVGWWNIPTVLVGFKGDETEVLKRLIEANPTVGIRVVAVIDSSCTQLPFRAKEFEQGAIPYALVIMPSGADRKWLREVERLVWGCKKIIVIPQATGLLWSGMHIRECCGTGRDWRSGANYSVHGPDSPSGAWILHWRCAERCCFFRG